MRTEKTFVTLVLVGVLAVATPAAAEFGTIEPVPGATLLLPYFEVAPDRSKCTFFSVNNASAAPELAHVTIWTDQSIPVLDFDVFLTGYDVQSFNLHDLLINGNLPSTGSLVSNRGQFSLSNGSPPAPFPGCSDGTPGSGPPAYNTLSPTFRAVLLAALTGQPIPAGAAAGLCAGADYGDGVLRGYVTVDTVNECSQEFPNTPGYFVDGGIGTASNRDTIWGDWLIIDAPNVFAHGDTLVHVEAEESTSQAACDVAPPGDNEPSTFYCRYSGGADDREALGSLHATRYLEGGPFTGGTDLLVWRDPLGNNAPYSCVTRPGEFSLTQNQIVVFDEQENPIVSQRGPSGFEPEDENPFLYETQRVEVGGPIGPTTAEPFGWIYLNLNGAQGVPAIHNQAWVVTVLSADGLYSVGYDALQLSNLSNGGGDFDGWGDNVCLGNNGSIAPCA